MPDNSTIISGSSYVNKDFNSIYGELLDLVKVLTNKWDPSVSNESDPGVVLIKLGALLADKDNYNADKNVLELFPQSVSQYGNARKIYDIAGYSMQWYMSAITTLNFNYTGNDITRPDAIRLNALTTMVSDDSGETVYTLIEDVVLNTNSRTASAQCIQGVIQDYEVNGVTNVTLENIDEYNRIYFTENMIAENGIFIANNSSDNQNLNFIGDWERVDNLESRPLSSKVYKFGVLPDSDTCYIEFPQDIANLIEGGLRIKYIVTGGSNGNISANTLTTFYSSDITAEKTAQDGSTEEINVTDQITITNPYAAVDGKDYEDLESAYNNYKDTVGTFNTLVTCKDYETAVNDVMDGRNYAASNCVVSDRTNDIVDSSVVTYLTSGGTSEVLVNNQMDAFKIGMYALYPMSSIVNAYYYNKSFSVNTNMEYIKNNPEFGISSYKSIQHDYLDTTPTTARDYIYKNCYKLTGTVATYYKVSSTDATEIENNIRTALYSRFNARNIDFGTEIEYDDLIDTIQNADSRIKYVMLNQPEYVVKLMLSNDTVGAVSTADELTNEQKINLLARMITAGNIQLYNFNHDFDYDFGRSDVEIYPGAKIGSEGITSITTTSNVAVKDVTSKDAEGKLPVGYTVRENENIILYTASLIADTSYTAYVNIRFQVAEGSSDVVIKADNYHVLQSGETLYVNYVDTNNVTQNVRYSAGAIIRPNFDLSSAEGEYSIEKTIPYEENPVDFRMITADEQIDIMKENATYFDTGLSCLWFTNDSRTTSTENSSVQQITYKLFPAYDNSQSDTSYTQSRLLQNNEYFLYTNADRNELVLLTSGTKIQRILEAGTNYNAVECTNLLNVGDITSNGQSAVGENEWYTWLSSNGDLSVHEQMIVTLGEGAVVYGDKVNNESESGMIGNDPLVIDNPQYKETASSTSSFTKLPVVTGGSIDGIDTNWYIMSRLNISASGTTPQSLEENQSITITYKGQDGEETTNINGGTGCNILTNVPITLSGGTDVDVTATASDGTTSAVMKIYKYTQASNTMPDGTVVARNADGYIRFDAPSSSSTALNLTYEFIDEYSYYLIPLIKTLGTNTLTVTSNQSGIQLFTGTVEGWAASVSFNAAGAHYLLVQGKSDTIVDSLKFTFSNDSSGIDTTDSLLIGKIYRFSSTNPYSDVVDTTLSSMGDNLQTNLINAIGTLQSASGVTFDYTHEVDSMDSLDFTVVQGTSYENNAFAPKMLWDINHICNKFTIAQMDTTNSSITVASTSRS